MAGDIGKLNPKEDFWKQVHFLIFLLVFLLFSFLCFFGWLVFFGGVLVWARGFFWRGIFVWVFLLVFCFLFCLINGTDLT